MPPDEGVMWQMEDDDSDITISLYAVEDDPSKLVIHFLDEPQEDSEEEDSDEVDFMMIFDKDSGLELAQAIIDFFKGDWKVPEFNRDSVVNFAKSLLKKPEA